MVASAKTREVQAGDKAGGNHCEDSKQWRGLPQKAVASPKTLEVLKT